jgi:hypothetical protein
MLTRSLHHIRDNAVAYLALFVALGGTSYAALSLPAGSVGGKQLRNHSIDPVKFNPRYINGSVRAWAEVNANGRVIAGRGQPRVTVRRGSGAQGTYLVRWRISASRNCLALGGVMPLSVGSGFADTVLEAAKPPGAVFVVTYNAQGQQLPEPFYTALIC